MIFSVLTTGKKERKWADHPFINKCDQKLWIPQLGLTDTFDFISQKYYTRKYYLKICQYCFVKVYGVVSVAQLFLSARISFIFFKFNIYLTLSARGSDNNSVFPVI